MGWRQWNCLGSTLRKWSEDLGMWHKTIWSAVCSMEGSREWMVDGFVAQSCLTLETPWTVAQQAPLSMGFPRQEYWSGLPFPSPGDHPNPGLKPGSPAFQADFFLTEL